MRCNESLGRKVGIYTGKMGCTGLKYEYGLYNSV